MNQWMLLIKVLIISYPHFQSEKNKLKKSNNRTIQIIKVHQQNNNCFLLNNVILFQLNKKTQRININYEVNNFIHLFSNFNFPFYYY